MSRLSSFAAAGAVVAAAGLAAVSVTWTATASVRPADVTLAGSAAPFTSHTPATGDVAATTQLTVQLWLKPDTSAAQSFATAVSTPGSPTYHHYLSPAAYTARYGATASQAAAAESWLRSQGFTNITTDSQRNYVRATAPVSKVNAAFHMTMKLYKATATVNAGRYPLWANDRPVTLPASLAPSVLGVTGLDNAAPVHPLVTVHRSQAITCSQYYGQHQTTGQPSYFGTTTFPDTGCGYFAPQVRSAYGMDPANTGAGQTIALIEVGLAPHGFATLAYYARHDGAPAPSPQRYAELSLGKNTCGNTGTEEDLDVQAAYAMAPGANELVVGGDSCNNGDLGMQGFIDADVAVLDGSGGHPLATIASNSWETGPEAGPASLVSVVHAYLVRSAAEGVGMYFSAGDGSAVFYPSSDPYATAVGGTTLGIGKTGGRLFETGWSLGLAYTARKNTSWGAVSEDGATGGGPSLLWPQPLYQKGVVPASMSRPVGNLGSGPVRSTPDISAAADWTTAINTWVYGGKGVGDYPEIGGGTSLSSPLVAGMVADAQQGQATPFGFINPAAYKLSGTSAFHDILPLSSHTPVLYRAQVCLYCGRNVPATHPPLVINDDQSQSMSGYNGQVTAAGYDNMTGVGTPNGQAFITALRGLDR